MKIVQQLILILALIQPFWLQEAMAYYPMAEVPMPPHYNAMADKVPFVQARATSLSGLEFIFHKTGTYDIYRKSIDATTWGSVYANNVNITTEGQVWIDDGYEVDPVTGLGPVYEYRIHPDGQSTLNIYFSAGVRYDQTGDRGRMILVIDETLKQPLAPEIDRMVMDFIGEGWRPEVIYSTRGEGWASTRDWDGSSQPEPKSSAMILREQIQAAYHAAPSNDKPKVLYLFGHLPIARSGIGASPDGHSSTSDAIAADGYYADIDGTWTDVGQGTAGSGDKKNYPHDGKWDQTYLTGGNAPEMGFGRTDMYDMPTYLPTGEIALLRRYLDKNHNYKHVKPGHVIQPKAVNFRTDYTFTSIGALRNFLPTMGRENIFSGSPERVGGDYSGTYYPEEVRPEEAESLEDGYEWGLINFTERFGPFTFMTAGGFDFRDDYGIGAKFCAYKESGALIYSTWKSLAFYWAGTEFMNRNPLATEGVCLAVIPDVGWPNHWQHRLGLGWHLGETIRLTALYGNSSDPFYVSGTDGSGNTLQRNARRQIINLMGDPTIRIYQVAPVAGVSVVRGSGNATVSWTPSPDLAVEGVHIYRSDSRMGPYIRLTGVLPHTGTSFVDATVPVGDAYYQVRAVKEVRTGSGSFLHESVGIFAESLVSDPPVIALDRSEITFVCTQYDSTTLSQAVTVQVSNPGGGSLSNLQVTDAGYQYWQATPQGNQFMVSLDSSALSLEPATYQGVVSVSADGARTVHLPITLIVQESSLNLPVLADNAYNGYSSQWDWNGGGQKSMRIQSNFPVTMLYDISSLRGKAISSVTLKLNVESFGSGSGASVQIRELLTQDIDEDTATYRNTFVDPSPPSLGNVYGGVQSVSELGEADLDLTALVQARVETQDKLAFVIERVSGELYISSKENKDLRHRNPLVTVTSGTGTPAIQETNLGTFAAGELIDIQLNALNESAPVTWSVPSGSSLPIGLSLNSDGKLSGVLASVGIHTFRVKAVETAGAIERDLTLEITAGTGAGTLPILEANASGGFDISWLDSSSQEEGYRIERRALNGGSHTITVLRDEMELSGTAMGWGLNWDSQNVSQSQSPQISYIQPCLNVMATATATPDLSGHGGNYEISVHRPTGIEGMTAMRVTIHYGDRQETKVVDMSSGAAGYISLGTYTLSDGDKVVIDNQIVNDDDIFKNAVADAVRFTSNNDGGAWKAVATVSANSTSYYDSQVDANTAYQYRVSPVIAGQPTNYSPIATASTSIEPPSPLDPPGGLSALRNGSELTLSWSYSGSDFDGFKIQYGIASSGGWVDYGPVVSSINSVTIAGLDSGNSYDLRVAAYRGAEDGPWSATLTSAGDGSAGPIHSGSDSTVGGEWRSTSVTKAYDIDGDDVYGTDGYYMFNELKRSDPVYVSNLVLGGATEAAPFGTQPFDDPDLPTGSTVADYQPAKLDLNIADGAEGEFLSFEISQSGLYRLGVITGHRPGESIAALRLEGPGGSTAEVSVDNTAPQYHIFEINSNIGDVYTLYGRTQSVSQHRNAITGIFWDSGASGASLEISSHPQSMVVGSGSTAELSVVASGQGTLNYQWYEGLTGDTSTPVGQNASSFTTPTLSAATQYWVRVSDDVASVDSQSATVSIDTTLRILFVGNSYTRGVTSITNYNTANVDDLNGDNRSGIPGVLHKLAQEAGITNLEIGLEALGGAHLDATHLAQKVHLIADGSWDLIVLQDQSDKTWTDLAGFRAGIEGLRDAIWAANPATQIYLYQTWGKPSRVLDGTFSNPGGLRANQDIITAEHEAAYQDFALDGVVPVGEAFIRAVQLAVSDDPSTVEVTGITNVWFSDNTHCSDAGGYLSALMFARDLLGIDPESLPTGPGTACADLGLDPQTGAALQRVAANTRDVALTDAYLVWVTQAGASHREALPGYDADFDGRENILEFLLSTHPLVADKPEAWELRIGGQGGSPMMTFRFSQRKDLGGLQYLFQSSDDLNTWIDRPDLVAVPIPGEGGAETNVMEVSMPIQLLEQSTFLRMIVLE